MNAHNFIVAQRINSRYILFSLQLCIPSILSILFWNVFSYSFLWIELMSRWFASLDFWVFLLLNTFLPKNVRVVWHYHNEFWCFSYLKLVFVYNKLEAIWKRQLDLNVFLLATIRLIFNAKLYFDPINWNGTYTQP